MGELSEKQKNYLESQFEGNKEFFEKKGVKTVEEIAKMEFADATSMIDEFIKERNEKNLQLPATDKQKKVIDFYRESLVKAKLAKEVKVDLSKGEASELIDLIQRSKDKLLAVMPISKRQIEILKALEKAGAIEAKEAKGVDTKTKFAEFMKSVPADALQKVLSVIDKATDKQIEQLKKAHLLPKDGHIPTKLDASDMLSKFFAEAKEASRSLPATEKQIEAMKKMGIYEEGMSYTKGGASDIIGKAIESYGKEAEPKLPEEDFEEFEP